LRGFAFAPDSQSFYYVHEPIISNKPNYRAVFQHTLGNSFIRDREIFFGGESDKVRLCIQGGTTKLAFILYSFSGVTRTSCYFLSFDSGAVVQTVVEGAEYNFLPIAIDRNKTLAITDRDAPNMRVVEVSLKDPISEFVDVIPPSDALIQNVAVTRKYIVASYNRRGTVQIAIYDHSGIPVGKIPVKESETVRVLASSVASDEIWIERESFTEPIQQYVYSSPTSPPKLWTKRKVPFASEDFDYIQVRYTGMDGEIIPMFLVGKRPILANGSHPTIMTSYGGFGVPMTPQFSVFVAYMMERDCLFALPNIRGGSEFGRRWHQAATRRNRQVAFDDFLGAAEWLIQTGRTSSDKLAIFGGSNSGLLVGAAMTQRPDLFRAVICMAPMLDMLRYHLFDNAHFWKEEFGTSEDKDDFGALLGYSPYHQVKPGTLYPATMIVSGDLDQNSNPLHARKMTARLQSANPAGEPILLDYGPHRGHAPVQPLSERVNALTDRMAFLCDRLHITE
jgi:prolyl oligopeptidase